MELKDFLILANWASSVKNVVRRAFFFVLARRIFCCFFFTHPLSKLLPSGKLASLIYSPATYIRTYGRTDTHTYTRTHTGTIISSENVVHNITGMMKNTSLRPLACMERTLCSAPEVNHIPTPCDLSSPLFELRDDHDGAERLLACDVHVVLHVSEDGWLKEEALGAGEKQPCFYIQYYTI